MYLQICFPLRVINTTVRPCPEFQNAETPRTIPNRPHELFQFIAVSGSCKSVLSGFDDLDEWLISLSMQLMGYLRRDGLETYLSMLDKLIFSNCSVSASQLSLGSCISFPSFVECVLSSLECCIHRPLRNHVSTVALPKACNQKD